MIWKVLTLMSVALGVLAHEPAISEVHMRRHDEPVHRGHHGELGHIGHELKHHEEYAWSYPSYEYEYKVHDPHTGDNHGQAEVRHGDEVKGEYYLVEPTGNKRVVKYHADKTGFHAEVHNSAPLHHVFYKPVYEHKPIHHEPHKPHLPLLKLEPIVVQEPKHLRPAHYKERIIHYPHHRVHYEEPHHHREHHQYDHLRRLYRDDKQQREQFEETEQHNQVEQETENQ